MYKNWNLEALYQGFDDTAFQADFAQIGEEIEAFKQYAKDNLNSVEDAAEKLEQYVTRYNVISRFETLFQYCYLIRSVESENAEALKYMDILESALTELVVPRTMLKAFLLKLEDLEGLIQASPLLREHRFFLLEQKQEAAYMLSEAEELVYEKVKLTGSGAWSTLYDQLTSTLLVEIVTPEGEEKILPLPMIRNMAYEKDPALRKAAYEAELQAYKKIEKPIAACLNAIKGEALTNQKMRGYDSVLDMTLQRARMDRESLDALLGAMQEYMPVFQRYFKHKAKLLGHSGSLPFYDLFAPVGQLNMTFGKEEAVDFVAKNFSAFYPELGAFAKFACDNDWVDWDSKEGKVGGAYCMNLHQIKESRVLMNFSGSFYDMLTLAHELGHAYHGEALKDVSPINSEYGMPIAEVASTFCETLVCEAALKEATEAEKLVILENSLQGSGQVVVDIYSRFLFEDEAIRQRENGSLSIDELKGMMLEAQKQAYGAGLDSDILHPYMWLAKGHYYDADDNYYNFPYAFGELFAKGLYSRYLTEGPGFAEKYKALLAATGCNSLYDVGQAVGIDIRDKNFWKGSLEIIAGQIEQFLGMEG